MTETSRQLAQAEASAAWVEQVAAFVGLLTGVWLVVSTFALAYPFTIPAVDARLREMGIGVALGIFSVARIRAPLQVLWSRLLCLTAGVVLIVMPLLFDYGPTGSLAVAWWNEIVTGIVVVVTTSMGWGALQLRTHAEPPRPDPA